MLPEFACNYLSLLQLPKVVGGGVDERLYVTIAGEERVPFSNYVRSTPSTINTLLSFRYFSILPTELQAYILTFCPGNVLFSVMQVSSTLRAEASKLFWAKTDTYFLVDADWLLRGGYPGYTHDDISFLAAVENIQVDYHEGSEDFIYPICDGVVEVRQDKITAFWSSLVKRCPRAKRVIINQCWASPSQRREKDSVPQSLRTLIDSCPANIKSYAFIVEEKVTWPSDGDKTVGNRQRWQRSVYGKCSSQGWVKIKSRQDWETVLAPAKRFNGPIGRWRELDYKGRCIWLEEDGLWPQIITAFGSYFSSGIGKKVDFSCPSTRCNEIFQEEEQWRVHAAEFHNQEWYGEEGTKILPIEIRGPLNERVRELANRSEAIRQAARMISIEWKEKEKEEREAIKARWIEQVTTDEAWEIGDGTLESQLFTEYRETIGWAKDEISRL